MFSDPLNADLNVTSGAAVTKPFTMVNNGGTSSMRVNFTAAVGDPKVLRISHTPAGKGSQARVRHVAQVECYSVVEGAEDPTKVAKLYVVADIPVTGITAAQKTALFHQFIGLLRGGSGNVTYDGNPADFFDRWVNGES